MTPGLDFDPRRGAGTLRFSYAGATADIAEGLRRLEAWRRRLTAAGRAVRSRRARATTSRAASGPRSGALAGFLSGFRRLGSGSRRCLRLVGGAPARRPPAVSARHGAGARSAARHLGQDRGHRLAHPLAASRRCGASASGTSTISETGSSPRSITSPNGDGAPPRRPPARRVGGLLGRRFAGAAAARAAPRLRPRARLRLGGLLGRRLRPTRPRLGARPRRRPRRRRPRPPRRPAAPGSWPALPPRRRRRRACACPTASRPSAASGRRRLLLVGDLFLLLDLLLGVGDRRQVQASGAGMIREAVLKRSTR